MTTPSLYLPLVSWHKYSNPNTTTLLYHYPHVYAGQKDGHIWVYSLEGMNLKHKYLLTGHTAAVTALCILQTTTSDSFTQSNTEDILFSADENGEIARWNTLDGQCQVVNSKGYFGIPYQLKVFDHLSKNYLFCCGESNEICILNATTLEVVRVWGGLSNWVTFTSYFDQVEKNIRLLTATIDGQLNVWDLELTNLVVFKEKQLINNAPSLISDNLTNRVLDVSYQSTLDLFMMITQKSITVFQLHHMEYRFQFDLPTLINNDEWIGGEFMKDHRIILWTKNGNVHDYLLKPHKESDQLHYSAELSTTYTFNNSELSMDNIKTTLCLQDDGQLYILTFCNRSNDESSYTINKLDQNEDIPDTFISRNKEILLKESWPVHSQENNGVYGSITITIPVSSNHLAIGYESGSICVVPLSISILYLNQISPQLIHHRQDTRIFENAHHGKVTCLMVPEHDHDHHLLSGGKDGCVKIWNLINGKFVAAFNVHASPVESFVEPTEQNDLKIRGCVVSIAYDHSLALISVESMTCLYIIPGYAYPLTSIQWRVSEDYVLFGYSDDTVFVWQLQGGHLDRVLNGKTSKQVMSDERWPINRIQSASRKTISNTSHTVHTKSILFKSEDLYTNKLFAQVYHLNIRKLVHELQDHPNVIEQGGRYTDCVRPLMPSVSTSSYDVNVSYSSPSPSQTSNNNMNHRQPSRSSSTVGSDPLDSKQEDDMDEHHHHHHNHHQLNNNNKNSKDNVKSQPKQQNHDHRLKKKELVSTIMSILISAGIEPAFEQQCQENWILTHQHEKNQMASFISYGIRGVNGYLTLVAPTTDEPSTWSLSPTLTATRLIAIALLLSSNDPTTTMTTMDGTSNNDMALFSNYVDALAKTIPHYCSPSLSLLSKYWQDAKARFIFSVTLKQLDKDRIESLVDYWKNYLPISSTLNEADTQMMTRATNILGIIGCEQPELLDDATRKSTALSLTLLLSDANMDGHPSPHHESSTAAPSTNHTMTDILTLTRILSSMELLSQGFKIWESYINASNVLRTLFSYATTLSLQHQFIKQGAKNSIFTIAQSGHMPLVIGTLTFDTSNDKNIENRLSCLRIISFFIRMSPILLSDHVYRVIEAVVKTLDPNIPHMRESVLQSATSILHDLVKIYPSVDFNSTTQKLVVGTLEGATIVYDLQTATRSVVFEGHTGSVSVVKFSPDAKLIATGSLVDKTVRVWYSNLSLLGIFTSSFSSQKQNMGTQQKPYKIFSFALLDEEGIEDPPQHIQFEWSSNRCVKLHVKDIVMSFNV
ncbi:hypothetical protein BJ944DRAFT_261192 [Cunninghamella echinulata]|nr:hypothetical protein BJ944DRAFT_261192 [Cunninghamella echinulata]